MALDSAAKRMSLFGYKFSFLGLLPLPDGNIIASDRLDLLGEYPGFQLDGELPPFADPSGYIPNYRPRRRR